MGKLNTVEVRFWLEECKSCLERRDKELVGRNNYPFLVKYYEGDMVPEKKLNSERNKKRLAMMNDYFPSVNALVSEIMFQNPEVTADPMKPQAEQEAPVMRSALTYGFKKLDALTENRIALFDMLLAGICGVEVNHINVRDMAFGDTSDRTVSKEGMGTKIKNLFKGATEAEDAEINLEKAIPTAELQYATKDETYLKRINPLDLILDYRADRVKDTRYRGKIVRMTHAEFSARYPKYKDKVQAGDTLPFTQHTQDEDKKLVTLYEVQIRQADDQYLTIIIAPSYPMEEIDWFVRPYTTNDFNLQIGVLHEYGKLYPISFAQINKQMQDDINNYTTFMMEVAERNIPKRGYNKNKLDADGIARLNSAAVNDGVGCDGGAESTWAIPATGVSLENKELLTMFQQQKEKLWNVSSARLQSKTDAKFATELQIQEAGFQSQQADIQEGLRKLIKGELEILKDIVVTFWDGEMFFKITGTAKPEWYEPQIDEMTGQVLNPLTDMLTGDYWIDVDISTALRPNEDKKKSDSIMLLRELISEPMQMLLMQQGRRLSTLAIDGIVKKFGLNPETMFEEAEPPQPPPPEPIEAGENKTETTEERADEVGNKSVVKQTQTQKVFQ